MTQDDHKHLHELISAMADGTLTPEEAAQAQIHLKDCADCRQLLHDIRRIATAVGEEGVPPVPGYLAGRIREHLITGGAFESRSLSPAIPFWKSPFPLAAAATLLLVSVIWLAWPGGSHVSPPPPAQGEPQTELGKDTMGERDSAKPEAPPPAARPSESVPMAPKTAQEKAQAPVPELEGHSGSLQPRVPSRLAAGDEGSRRNEAPAPSKEEAYLDRVTSSGLTGEDYKKAKGRERQDAPAAKDESALAPAASSAGSVSTVGEIRSLVYEGPDYSATFVED
ncbi:MAG TPA: zf-HC2 domain-containing protein, partial [Candidatus Polarisedimenticolia bacterium]|nr:zf-HC2 domain-containing protein [Candidatus Polarisedimenticolia bacterium]